MNARGLTLLESLLALALLSALAVALAGWTSTAVRATEGAPERIRWRSAAEATMRLIEGDLTLGDFPPGAGENERVRMERGDLILLARGDARDPDLAGRPVERRYRLSNDGRSHLILIERPVSRTAPNLTRERMLLGRVARFEAEISDDARALSVTLECLDGTAVHRRFRLP